MSYYDDVVEFHRAFDVPVAEVPTDITGDRHRLRYTIMREEWRELKAAMATSDLVEIADACADLIVTVLGTAAEYGIPFDAVWAEVHRSNMAKLGPNGEVYRRDDGKVIKPPGWTPPDIAAVLNLVTTP